MFLKIMSLLTPEMTLPFRKKVFYDFTNFQKQSVQKQPEMFYKKSVLKNFTKFTRKYQCQSFFFIKKKLWHRCFPVNFAKFLRTPFLLSTHGRLLLSFMGIHNPFCAQAPIYFNVFQYSEVITNNDNNETRSINVIVLEIALLILKTFTEILIAASLILSCIILKNAQTYL